MKIKRVVTAASLLALCVISGGSSAPDHNSISTLPTVTVYKDPSCGCCKNWVAHLQKYGFRVVTKDTPDMNNVKANLGIPVALRSCHTAVVAGYLVEGHVPAADIQRMLTTKPHIAGLAVPGMPAGSPGMEGAAKQPYSVVSFTAAGKTATFAKH